MGMYTEFVCAFQLKKETPLDVINILKYMCDLDNKDEPTILPEHDFFKCSRWKVLFICDSYYFPGKSNTSLDYDAMLNTYFLTIRSNLKNYDNEIGCFLRWIKPYMECYNDDFLGYTIYESFDEPTLIYYKNINNL